MKNNIVLICNDEKISENIKSKILLLRNKDDFFQINEENCFDIIKEKKPVLILYHCPINNEHFLDIISKVKQNQELKDCSIIAIFDEIDENILCTAFEKGLTDFLLTNSTDSEYTIRTIWCLQKREALHESESKKEILSQLKILDKKNHVYTENYTYTILKEESKKEWGTFVVLAPDIDVRSKISPDSLMGIIKRNVRSCDILGFASDFKIYLWFKQTEKDSVLKVLEKIKKVLTSNFTISAGYIETKNIAFDKAEEMANNALSKALLKGNSFIYAKEAKKKEINLDVNVKNFKVHKENLIKKLENILSPLFYQTQKRIEEKLFESKVTQVVEEEKSFFKLENEKGTSVFTVSCPGYTKINIEIIHDIKDSDLKAEKLFIDKEEITEEKIEYLLDSFIKNFQNYTNV